jgi:hypothetical protein
MSFKEYLLIQEELEEYLTEDEKAQIKALKDKMKKCSNSKNPNECRKKTNEKMREIRKKLNSKRIQKAKEKVKQTGQKVKDKAKQAGQKVKDVAKSEKDRLLGKWKEQGGG